MSTLTEVAHTLVSNSRGILAVDESVGTMSKRLESVGVGHFGLYLQHDAQDATLASYGERVLPGVNELTLARG